MITERARYAIKALVYLARNMERGLIPAGEISSNEQIPPRFLEVILVMLRRGGLITSKTGRAGGHRLAREPQEVTLLEILRTTDGPVAPLPCLSRTAYRRCDDCSDESSCGTRRLMGISYQVTMKALAETYLSTAIGASDQDQAGPPDWVI